MRLLAGPVLADLAANVLVMTLVVLIVVGRLLTPNTPPLPAETLTIQPVEPLDGAAAVESLRQRLLPGATGFADLGPDPTALPEGVTMVFILDPSHYPNALAELAPRRQAWTELTIPGALKTDDNRWSADFLALASIAHDPDRFRTGLRELLVRGHAGGGSSVALGGDAGERALHFPRWFQAALEVIGLTGLFAAMWGLLRLRRWSVKV
jgi:hypothetical protein